MLDLWLPTVNNTLEASSTSQVEAEVPVLLVRRRQGMRVAQRVGKECLLHLRDGRRRVELRCCCSFHLQRNVRRIMPQFLGGLLQPRKGQTDASAQIALGQFPPNSRIGIPVPLATLLAFFACSIRAIPPMKGERRDLTHPCRPGRAFRDDVQYFAALPLMQFVCLVRMRPDEGVACVFRHLIPPRGMCWNMSPNRVLPTAVDLTSCTRWVTQQQDENPSRRSSLNDDSISTYWNILQQFSVSAS